MGKMSCPMYLGDHARDCIIRFKELVNIIQYYICESDAYKDCPFYKVINKEVTPCEFLEKCNRHQKYGNLDFKKISELTALYCFSDNRVNCSIYKLRKENKSIPENLMADGTKIEIVE